VATWVSPRPAALQDAPYLEEVLPSGEVHLGAVEKVCQVEGGEYRDFTAALTTFSERSFFCTDYLFIFY
jgi:hypothetical protein